MLHCAEVRWHTSHNPYSLHNQDTTVASARSGAAGVCNGTMSTRKGASTRKGPPKHQNRTAFQNDLHHREPILKTLNNLQVRNVCDQCKKKLEWRIKFKKFKPRSSPGTCTKCSLKCVKHAYHIMCVPCAQKENICPKCGQNKEIVEVGPTPEEQMRLDVEMQAMLKSLPERKKRTFLRYMEKNSPEYIKKKEKREKKLNSALGKDVKKGETNEPTASDEESTPIDKKFLSKSDIMAKLEALKLSVKDEDFDDEDDDDFDNEEFSDKDLEETSDEG